MKEIPLERKLSSFLTEYPDIDPACSVYLEGDQQLVNINFMNARTQDLWTAWCSAIGYAQKFLKVNHAQDSRANAEVTGSPVLSASPSGLTGSAAADNEAP